MSMKTKLPITVFIMSIACITGISTTAIAADQADKILTNTGLQLANVAKNNTTYVIQPPNTSGLQRYIIRFSEPALAQYNGAGELAAIPKNADNSIQINTPAVQSYITHLKQQQSTFLTSISNTLGRNVEAILSYQYAYNGMAVYLSASEANSVKNSAQVAVVVLDKDYKLNTDAGPQLIGADNIWTGTSPSTGTALGEGIVIATLDTGINFDHPSFADIGGDGFDHTNPLGAGNFLGVCDSTNSDQFDAAYTCNDKLIGGFDFVNDIVPVGGMDISGPEDENGHGSHVASISGGNIVNSVESNGATGITISGVAPHATVVVFDVCYNTADGTALCPSASVLAAVDQILADGRVNVINYSMSAMGDGVSPWTDPVSLAFLNAVGSGIFVATSAGNDGPDIATLSHVEPWTFSSGASTHNRRFSNNVDITGPMAVPMNLTNMNARQGTGPALIANMVGVINYAGIVDGTNAEGCNTFSENAFDGVVALISRGTCEFAIKVNNAEAAGAIGVIVFNNTPNAEPIPMTLLEDTNLPSVMVGQVAGAEMITFITANPTATVNIDAAVSVNLTGREDSMASFSSRGPSPVEYNKPDVTAPGVNILAAFHDNDVAGGTSAEYEFFSGTSMASSHSAGAAALLKELNPSWSPTEIKSAIMMTAVTAGITKEDGSTPANPLDRGAGRVQVDLASSTGLVMHETAPQFLLADPSNGGDPKTLNVPNLTDYNCIGSCSFQREFRSVATGTMDYTAGLTGIAGTVTPTTFTVDPGQVITLNIEVDGTALTEGAISFGELVIETQSPTSSFAINPDSSIPDGIYNGTFGTMLCETITVSGISNPVLDASLRLAINHTWSGDLVIKLQNPDGNILGVMSRAGTSEAADDGVVGAGVGGVGVRANLASSNPITFIDSANTSAESLGVDATDDQTICLDNGICDYRPAPGAVTRPPETLGEMITGTNNGDWNICLGDIGAGDAGNLANATLNFTGEAMFPILHLPVVIIGFPERPFIEITPTSISAALPTNTTVDQILTVSNEATASANLNWAISSGSFPRILVEQEVVVGASANAIVSNFFTPNSSGVYSADDFTLDEDSSIANLFFSGNLDTAAANLADIASAIEVRIFANLPGALAVPAGHPEDSSMPIATLTIPIADPSLDLSDNNILIDVIMANAGNTIDLPAGTYWMTVFPAIIQEFSGANPRWNWASGTVTNTTEAVLIDPSDLFSNGFTSWTGLTSGIGFLNLEALNYSISDSETCGAPWLSVVPAEGTEVTPGSSTDVTVTFDSTGLLPGDYSATLCVDSDDPDEAQVLVTVTMTVEVPEELIFADSFETAP